MQPLGWPTATAQLAEARDRLRAIGARVEQASSEVPRRQAAEWSGIAADAYQAALDHLNRQVEGARELLRSATDLLGAALSELGDHD